MSRVFYTIGKNHATKIRSQRSNSLTYFAIMWSQKVKKGGFMRLCVCVWGGGVVEPEAKLGL